MVKEKIKIVLKNFQSPGDALAITPVLRDIHKNYPNQFETAVDTAYPEVFENNPYITPMERSGFVWEIFLDYGKYIKKAWLTGMHFTQAFHDIVGKEICANITPTSIYPELYPTGDEIKKVIKKFDLKKSIWLVNAGFKVDMPLKVYPPNLWNEVIQQLNRHKIRCVQIGSDKHIHPELKNTYMNLVGQTENLREYFALAFISRGSIGAVSLQMHVAAAFQKPCVVIAGGREDVRWEQYPNHQFLHTIGQLPCCDEWGCWQKQRNQCGYMEGEPSYPKCMLNIKPEDIVDKVLRYEQRYKF